ncbi:DUF4403 family protein [Spirosoma sp. KCTC 42546]|uniref:DUF4403 family protein n=1 Tax=Spirosoma sp. KCTC 42546 TaxID=2520506 RepID=UPI0011596C6F|nr:DUF4403 family protein [Spirosoma sp. KCTC 42546]QDK78333.1 DUF4403 family protein [Spirosoma sp. KCTC 42546]
MRTPPSHCYFIALSLFGLLTQCQQKKPDAPKAEGFDPPIPQTMSYVAGPITFQLTELQEKINKELDPVLVGNQSKDGKTKGIISFRVKRLGPVHVEYADQQIKLSAPLQMWLTKPFSRDTTPPKNPFCAINVNFKSPLSVTPNWRLASRTNFTNYTWIVQPKVLGFSLTQLVQNLLEKHKTSIEMAIDSAVYKELRLDKMVAPIWHDMQTPLLIDKDYGLWLTPRPISVAAGPVSGDGKQLTTPVRIALETKTELKPKSPVHARTPLPLLQKRDEVSQLSDLHLMSFIPYADINRMLDLTVRNKKLALGSLTIKHISVYGGQHSLIVKADLDGLMDGTVYLRGKPTFDTLTNTLKINNLDFDAASGNILSKSTGAVWHDGLRKLLEKLLIIRLGDDIAKLPQTINKAFEKGGAGKKTDLGIKSFRFTPQKIAIRPDGIQALINVESKVLLKVNQL